MKLRRLPFVSSARLGVVTRDGNEAVLAPDVRDARPQAIGALFGRLRGRGLEGDLRRFLGRCRVGIVLAPTRQ